MSNPIAGKLGKDRLQLLLHTANLAPAINALDALMQQQGYAIEQPSPGGRIYASGSMAGQVLLGGLSDRKKYNLTIAVDGDLALVTLESTANVLTSGAIGISKMRKELARLAGIIQQVLGPAPDPMALPPETLGRFAGQLTTKEAGKTTQYLLIIGVIVLVVMIAVCAGIFGLAAAAKHAS
jgi:hypothetical protein